MEIDFRSRPSQVGTDTGTVAENSPCYPPGFFFVFESITKGRDKTLTGETLKVSRRDFHVTADSAVS